MDIEQIRDIGGNNMTKKKALLIGIGLVFIAAIIVSVNLVFCASKYGNGVVTRISLA